MEVPMRVEWPAHILGSSKGGMYLADESSMSTFLHSASASFQLEPPTITAANCFRILSAIIGMVVTGTNTLTGRFSFLPIVATEWPAAEIVTTFEYKCTF